MASSHLVHLVAQNRLEDIKESQLSQEQITEKDLMGQTVLFHSAAQGNVPMCRLLLQKGADPLVIDTCGQNVLEYARLSRNKQLVLMIKHVIKDRQKQKKQQRQQQEKEKGQEVKQCYRIRAIDKQGKYHDLTKQEVQAILGDKIDRKPQSLNLKSNWRRVAYKVMRKLMKDQHGESERDWLGYSQEFHTAMREKKGSMQSVDLISIMGKLEHKIYQKKQDLIEDIKRMEQNCIQLYGKSHAVTKQTIQMRREFFELANTHGLFD